MELRNCNKCGRVFAYEGMEVCNRCSTSDIDDFKKVKDYLYENPGASIVEVSEETGVDEKKILRYLRESRIEIIESDNMILDCERCGKPIKSGRFCDPCVISMQKEFTAAVRPIKEKIEPKPKDPGKRDSKLYIADRYEK